jgi:hypothetical protein
MWQLFALSACYGLALVAVGSFRGQCWQHILQKLQNIDKKSFLCTALNGSMVCSLWFVIVPELDPAFPPASTRHRERWLSLQ